LLVHALKTDPLAGGESLKDVENLPGHGVLARKMAENLEATPEQFRSIYRS
jgi:hypothetical protein